jgi:MFS transporter, ACS family, glucarate transporter
MSELRSGTGAPTRVRWILIGWMFVVSAIAYLDRVNISIAGTAIAAEFHLTNIQLGWVFSSFILGYALFQAPGGWLADRVGPRRVLAMGVIWWGLFTSAITMLSPTTGGLLAILICLRFLLGAGEAVVYPASNCVVAAWIPSSERGLANGLIFSGVGFGAGVTPPLITYFLMHYGWRASFWVSAAIGLFAGGVWYLLARDKPEQHPWVSREEAELIRAGLPRHTVSGGAPAKMGWGAILRNRDVLAVTLAYFGFGYAAYIFFSWFFIYLNSVRGLNLRESSLYTMLPFVGMSLGSLLGGWISDQLTRTRGKRIGRCYMAAVASLLCAIFIVLGVRVESARLASFVLAGGAFALYLSQSSFWSVSADIGKSSAGSLSGFMNMGAQLGGALTASLTPAIANRFGWTASFLTAALLCGMSAIAWLLVDPERPAKKA